MIRLLALDLDGTMLDADYAISPRTRAAIRHAQALGLQISIVTGRNWTSTAPYVHELGLDGPQVVFNGSVVTANGKGDVLQARSLAWPLVEQLIDISRRQAMYLELHTMQQCYVESLGEESAAQRGKMNDPQTLIDFDTLDRDAVILKGQFIFGDRSKRQLMLDEERGLAGAGVFSWGVSPAFDGWFINVMPPNTSKGTGLDYALRKLGIGWDEVLAVGDSPSDLTYILPAGYGYVMANAPEEVRAQAPQLAPSVEKDGLAWAIERHLDGHR